MLPIEGALQRRAHAPENVPGRLQIPQVELPLRERSLALTEGHQLLVGGHQQLGEHLPGCG